jgi:hypothetical protein
MQLARTRESLGNSFRLLVAAVLTSCALGAALALLLLVTGSVVDGLIVLAFTAFAFRGFWKMSRRKRELLMRGYFVGQRVGTHWVYEELHDGEIASLELLLDYVGRGEYVLHVPGERDWLANMPAWAHGRRAEIVERLGTVFKRSQLHFDPDASPQSQ